LRTPQAGEQSLLAEQHFPIARQRPEIIGDYRLQLIAQRADGRHRWQDGIAEVLGVAEQVALGVALQDNSWSAVPQEKGAGGEPTLDSNPRRSK
jgi:hypothetical protein